MKQNITIEQLNELSEKGKKKLRKWWKPKEGDLFLDTIGEGQVVWCCEDDVEEGSLPLLSIGQMIEFLDEHLLEGNYQIQRNGERNSWRLNSDDIEFDEEGKSELCDMSWQAVKEILEK